MARRGLTVTMIVRDEAQNLEASLPAVAAGADEIIVVDTGSMDDSVGTARLHGARVVTHAWSDDFSAARNRALDEVRTTHAMWLDADDRITTDDLRTVRREALRIGNAGLMLRLVSENPNPDFVSRCHQLRVFPARPEHRFEGRVHEQIQRSLAATRTPIGTLDVEVRHLGYDTPETVARKSLRNLALCRRAWEEGERGVASAYHYVKAASLCGEDEEGIRIARACLECPAPAAAEDILQSIRVSLGRMEWKLGRGVAAEAAYRDAVAAEGQDPFARLHLGELLRLTGRPAEALPHLEAADGMPTCGTRVPLPVEGMRRAIRRERDAARSALARELEAYDRALRTGGPDPTVLTRLAGAYEALGEPAAARLGYEEALRLAPHAPEAAEGLRRLEGASPGPSR